MSQSGTPGRPSLRTRLLAGALLLLVAGLALIPSLLGEKAVLITVDRGELVQSVVASGKVRSPQRMELGSQVSGRILKIVVREGQSVAAGDLLLQLEAAELQAAADQAQAGLTQSTTRLEQMRQLAQPLAGQALRQAEANLAQARRHFERTRDLAARGFYSPTQLDDARRNLDVADAQWQSAQLQAQSNQSGGSDYRLAEAAVAQARAGLALAHSRLDYARIVAPRAGTILTRHVEPGDTAQPGKTLLTLAPAGTTELIAQIDEKNLGLLKTGQKALASADAYPDRHFAGEINFISPAIDPLRGSVEIRLLVPEPPDYLRQEMTVSIDIETARRVDALVIPLAAVRDADSAQPWVLVVREGIARRQAIELGARSDGRVEIRRGLAAGEQIVGGQSAVRDGSRVRAANG